MTVYFTAHEALEKVEGLNSLSTLNKWANFIQKECDYKFHYDFIHFTNHTAITHRKARLFSTEDIQKFQNVAKLIPTLGKEKALRKIFDQHYLLNTMSHSELIAEIMNQVEIKLIEFHTLEDKFKKLERQYHTLEKHFIQLDEILSSQEHTSSGWFRRKR